MKFTLLVALTLSIGSLSDAAIPTKMPKVNLTSLPEITADFAPSPLFDPSVYRAARKPAGEFSENLMSKDMKELRDRLAKVTSADEFEALIANAKLTMKDKSDDAQFIIAQAATLLPMRGIVWRLRPLFEQAKGFLGTKSTHVAAVQLIREVSATLTVALPSNASDLILQFTLEPSNKMTIADQFRDVPGFQNFLIRSIAPAHFHAVKTIEGIIERNPKATFVFDNKMAFGKGTFTDGIQRFVGFAAPEMHLAAAAHLSVLNETYVFCSYNQSSLIDALRKLGGQMGLDSTVGAIFTPTAGLGITDQERVRVIKSLGESKKFLTRLDGSEKAMNSAYAALVRSVRHINTAHIQLLTRPAGRSFAVDSFYMLKPRGSLTAANVKTALAAVEGPIEIRDPITAEIVQIDVPKFYSTPPETLTSLMASDFVLDQPVEFSRQNTKGEKLVYRNYAYGTAKGWSNEVWKTYVPSATGKGSEYMSTVRRVVARNPGAASVFGLPAIFIH